MITEPSFVQPIHHLLVKSFGSAKQFLERGKVAFFEVEECFCSISSICVPIDTRLKANVVVIRIANVQLLHPIRLDLGTIKLDPF